jgi:hypothetical protein
MLDSYATRPQPIDNPSQPSSGESEYSDDLRHKPNNNKFTDFTVISVDHEQQRNPSIPPTFYF